MDDLSQLFATIHLNDDQALVLIAANDHHADELQAAADLIPERFRGRVLVVGEDLAAHVLERSRFELVRDTFMLRAEVQGIVRAGQLPEAESAILADLLDEFERHAQGDADG